MNPTGPRQLQPSLVMPVTLSFHHLQLGYSRLDTQSGIEVSLPKSETGAPIHFRVIISEATTRNLLLKSFYDLNVRGKAFDGTDNVLSSLADLGISRCAFRTALGMMQGQPLLNDQTAPQFKVDGISRLPFMYQGHSFLPEFLICDHIFCQQEYEAKFVAVLSIEFLQEYFIRAQFNEDGWMIQLPPLPVTQISELLIFTHGCCLYNGLAAGEPQAKPARGGYGIYFPNLPNGWDMYGHLRSSDSHTNQKAELIAVIRALQLVRLRKIPCKSVSIFTDSKYAVQGLNEWIPNTWRSNGYRTATNRAVVNADLFKSLDEEILRSTESSIPVTLGHVPRTENKNAEILAKRGAISSVPLMRIGNPDKGNDKEAGLEAKGKPEKDDRIARTGAKAKLKDRLQADGRPGMTTGKSANAEMRPEVIFGKGVIAEMRPLVQWTPDGDYWAEWHSTGGKADFRVVDTIASQSQA